MNQCDGCARGLPIRNGNHYEPKNGHTVMGCAAPLYADVGPATRCPTCGGSGATGVIHENDFCPDLFHEIRREHWEPEKV